MYKGKLSTCLFHTANNKKYSPFIRIFCISLQIQFFLMIVFVTIIAPMSGCTMVNFSYLMDIFLAPLFLYLFYRFYTTNFQSAQKAKEEDAKKVKQTNGIVRREIASNDDERRRVASNVISKKEE